MTTSVLVGVCVLVWQGVDSSTVVDLGGVHVTVRVRLHVDRNMRARHTSYFTVLTLDVPGDLR